MQKASAFLSLLCAIHCLALPVLATLMASSAMFSAFDNPLVEILLLAPLLLMTIYSAYYQLKHRHHLYYLLLLVLGIAGIAVGLLLHLHWLMGASALYLAAFQWSNRNHTHTCPIN